MCKWFSKVDTNVICDAAMEQLREGPQVRRKITAGHVYFASTWFM